MIKHKETKSLPQPLRRRMTQAVNAPRSEAEAILRDVAFVLKMTQKVRASMDVPQTNPGYRA